MSKWIQAHRLRWARISALVFVSVSGVVFVADVSALAHTGTPWVSLAFSVMAMVSGTSYLTSTDPETTMSDTEPTDDGTVDGDLFNYVIDSIQYDFRDDDDGVQGNWRVTRVGGTVTIAYDPFPDSPYPAKTATYQVTKLSETQTPV